MISRGGGIKQASFGWDQSRDLVSSGPFFDYAPTGRPIRFPLILVIPFRDSLMAGDRFYHPRSPYKDNDVLLAISLDGVRR
jgi:hypothetical protein